MGTHELNVKKYYKLWDLFEKSLEKEGLSLSSFSKKWDVHSNGFEDYNKIYDKLKHQRQRKNKKELKEVKLKSITQLEEYIRFIDKDFTAVEIRKDELYEHWFD